MRPDQIKSLKSRVGLQVEVLDAMPVGLSPLRKAVEIIVGAIDDRTVEVTIEEGTTVRGPRHDVLKVRWKEKVADTYYVFIPQEHGYLCGYTRGGDTGEVFATSTSKAAWYICDRWYEDSPEDQGLLVAARKQILSQPAASEKIAPTTVLCRICWVSSLISFVMCLFLVAYSARGEHSNIGLAVLIYGPLGLLVAFNVHWPWLANLALFASWFFLCFRAAVMAAIFGGAALLSAAHFFSSPRIVDNEGGVAVTVSIGPGYWFWLLSIACALAAALVELNMDRPASTKSN